MTLKEFIRQLTIKERIALSEQVHVKPSYLNKLASCAECRGSINLHHAVLYSDVNSNLPADFRFTNDDYIEHRKLLLVSANKQDS